MAASDITATLVERLRKLCAEQWAVEAFATLTDAIREIDRMAELEAEVAALRKDGWIPVSERMPTDGETVLVWCVHGGGFPAVNTWQMQRESPVSWSSATIPTGLMWDDYEFEEISHWMPLPASPIDAALDSAIAAKGK